MDARQDRIYTSRPGQIESFDPATQRASVQPLVRQAYQNEAEERVTERLPIIHDVPVVFPGTSGGRITFPIFRGDVVLLVFTDCSLDRWLAMGDEVDPQDDRRNSVSDCIAFPGLYSFNRPLTPTAPTDAVVIHGEQTKIGGPEADDPVVRKSDLDAFIATYNSHIHPCTGGTVSATADTQDDLDCSPDVKVR